MPVKTFTQATLTRDDLKIMSSKGETCIASVSMSAVSSLSNCFTSTYENYKIVVSNFVASTDCYLYFQVLIGATPGTTQYYQGGSNQAYSTGAITAWNNNAFYGFWFICGGCTAATNFPNSAVVNVSRPALAVNTCITGQATWHLSSGIYTWNYAGQHALAFAVDGFRWLTTAGTVSSGTISVYGLTQA